MQALNRLAMTFIHDRSVNPHTNSHQEVIQHSKKKHKSIIHSVHSTRNLTKLQGLVPETKQNFLPRRSIDKTKRGSIQSLITTQNNLKI